jgi:germination protein M
MKKSTEVLVRAAFVQTMSQLPEVEFVSFYVKNEPLRDNDGNIIGLMSAQDFVQNTGSSIGTYQTTDLKLYYADKEGKQLKETKKTNIRYNSNTAIEKLVVEQLMKGTNATNAQSIIPETTKLLGVSVKDGVCYVNLDENFLSQTYIVSPEVTVFSITNSLVELSNVNKVQISINGDTSGVYREKYSFTTYFERNLDLVQK